MNERLALVLIARYFYAHGVSYISDAEYDEHCKLLKDEGIVLNPIYEDDPIPYDAFICALGYNKAETDAFIAEKLQALGSLDVTTTSVFTTDQQDLDFLTESSSLSITSVNKFTEAFDWFTAHVGEEIVISTKIDGINTRRGYMLDGDHLTFKAALTRGRSSDPINITENMRKISPATVSGCSESLVVYSETVVESHFIAEANQKYDCDYTIPRGLAMAMMRVDKFEDCDYSNLKSFVFRVDWGNTLVEGLELARRLGFDVVPYVTYTYNGESFDAFKLQMETIIRNLKDSTDAMDIVTDGMVAEVNDRYAFCNGDITNNYSSANIALKIGLWEPGVYTSKVVRLDLSPQFDRCACVAVVEPVIAAGGQTITRVNCYNPSVLFDHNILPGAEIRFEYKNETTVNIILE